MALRPHPPTSPLLFGYDPERGLPVQHLARLVERVVEESLPPKPLATRCGQPAFDPRLCAKVLLYGYATGVRSSRRSSATVRRACPTFTSPVATRLRTGRCAVSGYNNTDLIETVWLGLFAVAREVGIARLGRMVVDSSKLRADASPEAVVKASEYEAVLAQLRSILNEAEAAGTRDDAVPPSTTHLEKPVETAQMRDILRLVRQQLAHERYANPTNTSPADTVLEPLSLGPQMRPRIAAAIATLETAQQKKASTPASRTQMRV